MAPDGYETPKVPSHPQIGASIPGWRDVYVECLQLGSPEKTGIVKWFMGLVAIRPTGDSQELSGPGRVGGSKTLGALPHYSDHLTCSLVPHTEHWARTSLPQPPCPVCLAERKPKLTVWKDCSTVGQRYSMFLPGSPHTGEFAGDATTVSI